MEKRIDKWKEYRDSIESLDVLDKQIREKNKTLAVIKKRIDKIDEHILSDYDFSQKSELLTIISVQSKNENIKNFQEIANSIQDAKFYQVAKNIQSIITYNENDWIVDKKGRVNDKILNADLQFINYKENKKELGKAALQFEELKKSDSNNIEQLKAEFLDFRTKTNGRLVKEFSGQNFSEKKHSLGFAIYFGVFVAIICLLALILAFTILEDIMFPNSLL